MKPVKSKRRRSSKRRPMTMAFVLSNLRAVGVDVQPNLPSLMALVPFVRAKRKASGMMSLLADMHGHQGDFMGKFRVDMRDLGERVSIDTGIKLSVPKERVEDALKLLRRLHEM